MLPVGQTNFQIPIANALKSGSRVFILFMTVQDMGALILQGYEAGLFGEGTQIIVSDGGVTRDLWAGMPVGDVTAILKGVIGFGPSTDYSTRQGQKFIKSFTGQPDTTRDPVTGRCNNATDDTGHFLHKGAYDPTHPNVYSCAGFNYSSLHKDGSDSSIYAAYAYDATMAIAKAIDVVLYGQKQPLTGKGLYRALINNVSFTGITGSINFSHALTKDSTRFAEGDRRTGVRYGILNFNPAAYNSDPSGGSGFVSVGYWTAETGNKFTSAVTYSTADNSPPSDLPNPIILQMSPLFKVVLKALGIFLFLFVVLIGLIMVAYRKSRLLKATQIKMQYMIIIGGLFGAARVVSGFLPVTARNCSMNVWFGHLSFWFIFGPMLLKTYRVHKIVNNKTMKKVKIPENHILFIFMSIIFCVIVHLAFLQGLSAFTPIMVRKVTLVGIQYYIDDQCVSRTAGEDLWCHIYFQLFYKVLLTILHHIISYKIISYKIISYKIISYKIISYKIISYKIISYKIISY